MLITSMKKALVIQTKNQQEVLELNDTINQLDLTDVYRIFHSTTTQYTFSSAAPGTFSKIDHVFGNKASLRKHKKTEITPSILSDHNAFKLKLNNKKTADNMQIIGG
jgi:exonuclease III